MYVLVVPDVVKLEKPFWYSYDETVRGYENIKVGSLIRINLHSRRVKGWVIRCEAQIDGSEGIDIARIKPIIEYIGLGVLEHLVPICSQLASHYLVSPVVFLRACTASRIVKKISELEHKMGDSNEEHLYLVDPRADRRDILRSLISTKGSTIIVTPDSHKKILSWCKDEGHNAVLYDHDTKSNVGEYIRAMGPKSVIVGSRLALFSPVNDCDSIIILDDSYEQLREERSPQWHALDIARLMGKYLRAKVSVVTSVPSVMTYNMPMSDLRIHSTWPKVRIENRDERDPALGIFQTIVVDTINECIEKNMDVAIFTNSISASKLLVCANCDQVATCENCRHSVELIHADSTQFQCRLCQTSRPIVCLHCKSTMFKKYRKGLSSIAAEAAKLFSRCEVVEIYKGSSKYKPSIANPKIYVATESFLHQGDLAGNIGVAIFFDLDAMLLRPSMNAFNQTCVMINRAIKIIKKSDITFPVVISTRNPTHEMIEDIVKTDFCSQRERELAIRRELRLAPFYATADITSERSAIEEIVPQLDPEVIIGQFDISDALLRLSIRSDSHSLLTSKTYEILRKLASKSRYAIAVDVYE